MSLLRKFFWTILLTLIVFILSVIPLTEVPELPGFHLLDKWVHFVMYGALSTAAWMDFFRDNYHRGGIRGQRGSRMTVFLWAFAFPALFGALMEVWQEYLTTTRNGDLYDWIADFIGVLIALPIGLLIVRPLVRRSEKK